MAITARSALRPRTRAHSTWGSAGVHAEEQVRDSPAGRRDDGFHARAASLDGAGDAGATIVPAGAVVCRVRRRCVSTFDEIDEIETIGMSDRVLASGRARAQAAVAERFELSLPAGSGTGPATEGGCRR